MKTMRGRIYFDPKARNGMRLVGTGRGRIAGDVYHNLIRTSWPRLILFVSTLFFVMNTFFATLYLLIDNGIANARAGFFWDYFFFSVHTLTTIGYGHMFPQTFVANCLVSVEAYTGLISAAVMTGLIFSKFSVPKARVAFSRNAVLTVRDGKPAFLFRMSNERNSQVVEAKISVVLMRNEVTAEGEKMRRLVDLVLDRRSSPVFSLSWTSAHYITPDSPLFGACADDLAAVKAQVFISCVGIDNVTGQTVHARHTYNFSDIVWNARLVDMLGVDEHGMQFMDLSKFHYIEALDASHPLYLKHC